MTYVYITFILSLTCFIWSCYIPLFFVTAKFAAAKLHRDIPGYTINALQQQHIELNFIMFWALFIISVFITQLFENLIWIPFKVDEVTSDRNCLFQTDLVRILSQIFQLKANTEPVFKTFLCIKSKTGTMSNKIGKVVTVPGSRNHYCSGNGTMHFLLLLSYRSPSNI
jgi:hypothetical protein